MVTLWVLWYSIISLFQRESQGTEVLNNTAAKLKPGLQPRLSGPKPEFLKHYTDESHMGSLMLATEMLYYILIVPLTSPQKRYIQVLTHEPLYVTLSEKRVFSIVFKLRLLRWDHPRFREGPKFCNKCHYKRKAKGGLRHRDTWRKWYEDRGRDGIDTSTNQERQGRPMSTRC